MAYYFIDRHCSKKGRKLNDLDSLLDTIASLINHTNKLDYELFRLYKSFDYSGKDFERYYWDKGCFDGYYPLNKPKDISKRFIVFDESGRVVDIRNYDSIIRKKTGQIKTYKRFSYNKNVAGTLLYAYRYSKLKFRFRRGSVPYIHVYHGNYTRSVCRKRDIINHDLMRPKNRWNYIDWDEPYRHCDRSWKTSYKCKHQWEKHLIRRGGKGDVYIEI